MTHAVPDGVLCWWADFRSAAGMPDGWVVDETDTEFHAAVLEWVQSLGLNPAGLLPALGVCPWQGEYELHVDEIVADRGDPLGNGNLLTQRRILHVEPDSWPARPATVAA